MIRPSVAGFLAGKRIPHAVIGAVALAVHGAPRYSAGVDVLVLDPVVLSTAFWAGHGTQPRSIRSGGDDDPLVGLVLFAESAAELPTDVVVGRGYAARFALDTAAANHDLGCPVVSPLGLALLKLEAGGIGDLQDLVALQAAQQQLTGWDLPAAAGPHLPRLSTHAQEAWGKLATLLSMQAEGGRGPAPAPLRSPSPAEEKR